MFVLLVLIGSLVQTSEPPPSLALQEGVTIEAQLTGGATQTYPFWLTQGTFLSVVAQQQGVDVILVLYGPDGTPLVEVDGPGEAQGEETLVAISVVAGEHRLTVRASDADAAAGSYSLRVETLRAATLEDENRVEAQTSFLKAQELLYKGMRSGDRIRHAIQELTRALGLQERLNDRRGLSWTLHALGWAHALLGEQRQALSYLLRVLPLRRENGGASAEGKTLQSIGAAYADLGELEKALEFLNQALASRKEAEDQIGEGVTLHSLGLLYRELGDFDKTISCFREALKLSRITGYREDEFNAINSLGSLYSQMGEHQQALTLYQEALEIARRERLRLPEAIVLNNIGTFLADTKQYEQALPHLREAHAIFQEVGHQPGATQALQNIAVTSAALGRNDEALSALGETLSFWRQLGRRRSEANALRLLGRVEFQTKRLAEAKEHFLQSLALQRETGNRLGEAESLLGLARLLRDQEGSVAALDPIENAVRVLESIRSEIRRDELRVSFLSTRRTYYEFYVDVLMELERSKPTYGYAARALQVTERARARLLLDTLSEAGTIRQGADPELLQQELSLQRKINLLDRERLRAVDRKSPADRITALERELDTLLRDLEAIRAEIRSRSPRYAALTQPEPLSAQRIQSLLDPGTLLLSYSLGEEKSFVWAVTSSSLTARELPARAEIEAASREFHDLLSQSDRRLARRATEQAASRLAEMILGPVEKLLGKNRLVIIADGALHYVPFAVLPSPGRPGAPLVTEHEIVNLPSASVLAVLRKETADRAPASRQVAILADPVFRLNDPRVNPQAAGPPAEPTVEGEVVQRAAKDVGLDEFPRLRYTRQEAEAIASLLPPEQVLKALDFEASKETATRSDLSRYRILHFATHGLLDTRRPELSGLVLSLVDRQGRPRDGFLRLHEIYNLDLPADLVVLSGCETALGKEVRGEGLMALTRGFMYAGAPAVVASLWQIDDRSTGELMKRFYRGMIKEGLSAPAALRKAQIALWKEKPTEAPYFWAGFVFQGDWRASGSN